MADDSVDDDLLENCDVCGGDHETELCPELGLDASADETNEISRARLTLPHNLMAVENIEGEGVCVVATADIPAKTQFGPFEAKRSTNDLPLDNYFVLKILGRDGKNILLDASDENECNWLCLVRTASAPAEQNCMAYQLGVNIFYNTTRRIQTGEELRVWYAAHYAKKLGRTPQSDGATKIMLGSNVGDLLSLTLKVEPLEEETPPDRGDEPREKRRRTMRSDVEEFLAQTRRSKRSRRDESTVQKPETPAKTPPAKAPPAKAPPAKTQPVKKSPAKKPVVEKTEPPNRRRSVRNRASSVEEQSADEPTEDEPAAEAGERETTDANMADEEDDEWEDEGGQYQCPRCPKNFASQATMVKHLRAHIKVTKSPGVPVRTLFCTECDAGFVNSSNLNRHMKTHNRSKNLIKCSHCNYKTYRHDIMRTHHESKHHCDYETPNFPRSRSVGIKKEIDVDETPKRRVVATPAITKKTALKKETLSALQLKRVPGKPKRGVQKSTPAQTPSTPAVTPIRVMPSRQNRGKRMLEALSTPSKTGKSKQAEEEEEDSSEEEIMADSEDEWKADADEKGLRLTADGEDSETGATEEETQKDGDNDEAMENGEDAEVDVTVNKEAETPEEGVVGNVPLHVAEQRSSVDAQTGIDEGELDGGSGESGETTRLEQGMPESGEASLSEAGEVNVAESEITWKQGDEEDQKPVVRRGRPRKSGSEAKPPKLEYVDVFVTQDNRKVYGCKECGKKFQSLKYVKVHYAVHSKRFPCETCGKFYAKKESLDKHICTTDIVPVIMVVEGDRPKFNCTECGKSFSTEEYARQHYSIHTGVFKCKTCNQRFYSKAGLTNHKCNKDEEKSKVFSCDICHQTFRTAHYLYRHLAMHTDIFKCNICGKCFSRKDSLQRHVLKCDPVRALEEDIHACVNCNKAFSSSLTLDNHMISCYKNFCADCKETFSTEAERDGHVCSESPEEDKPHLSADGRVNCRECGKNFCNLKYLKRHEAAHNGAFQCTICDKAFSRKEELIWHMTMCEATEKVKTQGFVRCDHCEEEMLFADARAFREHFVVHTHPYRCEECGKRFRKQGTVHTHNCDPEQYRPEGFKCHHCERVFKTRMLLDKHIVIHGERQFECEVCQKKFFRKDYINDHQCLLPDGTKARVIRRNNRVVVKENVVCHLCGRSFVSASNLNKHVKTHGERQYACDVCGKKFHYQAYLKDHKFHVHGGGVKLQCSQCGKIMKTKTSLKSHLKQFHSDSVPEHPCQTCGKVFRQRGNLKTHMFSHTKEKHFQCEYCDKAFKYPDQYNRHKLEHTMTDKIGCELCEKKFVKKFEYRKHMAVFHSGMAYLCDICNAKCSHRHTLVRHFKRKHPGAVGLLEQENYVESLLTPLKQTEARRMANRTENAAVTNTAMQLSTAAITTEATTAATMSIGQTFTNELGETFAESVITDAEGNETTIVYQTPDGFNTDSNLPQMAAEALQSLSHTIMTSEDFATHVQLEVQDSEHGGTLQLADLQGHELHGDDQQTVVILQIVDEDEQVVETIVE